MTISRKMFSANVTLPANTATSLYTLMRDSALHWGYESTALTQPSMDSILGSEGILLPSGDVYVGIDSNVRNAALGGSTYQGVLAAGGQKYVLEDFGPRGMIDPNQIWLFAQSEASVDLTFQAR